MARSDHSDRSKAERIARLKERVAKARQGNEDDPLLPIMIAVLDLLADEL